jgi:hypothetical protein
VRHLHCGRLLSEIVASTTTLTLVLASRPHVGKDSHVANTASGCGIEGTVDAVALLRSQFGQAHWWLDQTTGDVSSEQLHWCAADGVMPCSAQYAHTVMAEDFLLNAVVRGGQPLMMTSWAGKTGVSEPPPPGDWGDWSRTVRVDLEATRAYAEAVFAETDSYLASLSASDLDREFDPAPIPIGTTTVASMMSIILGNVYTHSGEISSIKGLQGLKGYPL